MAPQYLAQEFLRMEGFTEIEYIAVGTKPGPAVLANGQADFTMWFSPGLIPPMDDGDPIVVLAGVHAGCYELFGNESVNSIRDLKGKTIAVQWFGGGDHIFMASMLAYVGMDPTRDVHWVSGENSLQGAMDMFIDGRADAFLAFDPQPHEMRARNLGKVIVNTTLDRPWSQYFCCMIAANRDYVRRYPVATRHVVRAILKSADICSSDPERAARYLSDYGYETRYPVGLSVMRVLPYDRWRHANPEDTLRFHALRLYEVGMIKTNPNRLIEQGTDWRFLNELKREMKA
ncbi:MAG: ABC transporter substrate-binding protein [Burkholderiales bacterium]